MTLYLKYRPQTLSELDLAGVRESLTSIFKSKNIPHAFLFAGPKGTGKTSAARIVAKILNCEQNSKTFAEPCNKCQQCLSITKGNNIDVVELDAASHRGIDDIRALRDAVKLSPASARKKVYIIDEAHMLTTEAFNAFLKTLEEPPDHVVFILATTNPEKIIDTIKSRTTLITFAKAKEEEIVSSLEKKVKAEKIKYDKKALGFIAKSSEGSFRDGAKILEQLIAENVPLLSSEVEEYFSTNGQLGLDEFILKLKDKNEIWLLNTIEGASQKGQSFAAVIEHLLDRLHKEMLISVGVVEGKTIFEDRDDLIILIKLLMDAYGATKVSFLEQIPLELAVIKWCSGGEGEEQREVKENENEKETTTREEAKQTVAEEVLSKPEDASKKDDLLPNMGEAIGDMVTDEVWQRILAATRVANASIEALLRAARPLGLKDDKLVLGVYYKFHKERLEEIKQRQILERIVGGVLNSSVRVSCVLTEPPKKEVVKSEEVVLIEPGSVLPKSDLIISSSSDPLLTKEKEEDIIEVAKKMFS